VEIEICRKLQTSISTPILYAGEKYKVFSFLNNFFIFKAFLMTFGTLIKKIMMFYLPKYYEKICISKFVNESDS